MYVCAPGRFRREASRGGLNQTWYFYCSFYNKNVESLCPLKFLPQPKTHGCEGEFTVHRNSTPCACNAT